MLTRERYRKATPDTQPAYNYPPYTSTRARAPRERLIEIPQGITETTGPQFRQVQLGPNDSDLTTQAGGAAHGERIIVTGRVLDETGRPIPHTLIELWQANAAGRYRHPADQHAAPLDPNFTGAGRVRTDAAGYYRFLTIRPGAYPWRNHPNAWRPAHLHFSIFGPCCLTRLVTQMYFPGDPLLPFDPIFNSTADANARQRLVAELAWEVTQPEFALGFRFDLVLRGPHETPSTPG
ncbi:MAG: protocatechuate 3,4-dioxygenase subunit beta [Gammaproteobacteria bacterium]|nr:protocatechuate 3,4-dioxygenase subunit beta [Gammaproteobacteria bacterium]